MDTKPRKIARGMYQLGDNGPIWVSREFGEVTFGDWLRGRFARLWCRIKYGF